MILKHRSIFARFGQLDVMIFDDVPFNSMEFKKVARRWDVQTITIYTFYSQSTGLAEKSISVVKNILRKSLEGRYLCISYGIQKYLA